MPTGTPPAKPREVRGSGLRRAAGVQPAHRRAAKSNTATSPERAQLTSAVVERDLQLAVVVHARPELLDSEPGTAGFGIGPEENLTKSLNQP